MAVPGILEQAGILTIHEDYFLLTGGLERGWIVLRESTSFQMDCISATVAVLTPAYH